MVPICRQIQETSKLESGTIQPFIEEFDLQDTLKACSKFTKPIANEKKLELNFGDFDEKIPIESDKTKLKQTLFNLIVNAIKYTEKGHVNISVRSTPNTIKILVKDTGTGLSAEEIKTIFDPYTKVNVKTGINKSGVGLGLAISKKSGRK